MFRNQSRPVRQVVESSGDRFARLAQELRDTEGSWFDGTVGSITDRRHLLAEVIRARKSTVNESELHLHLSALQEIEVLRGLDEKLADVEAEYIDHESQESVQSLPQYSVMANLNSQPKLGESYRTARRLPVTSEWHKFCSVEPKLFVTQNRSCSNDSYEMRTRAVDFISVRTASVGDPHRRASIISHFVYAVERERRTFNQR